MAAGESGGRKGGGSAKRRRGRSSGGRGGRRRSGRPAAFLERARTLFTTAVLLAAGALIGSFWIEWRRAELPPESGEAVPALERRIKVEVLNGSGEPGVARRVGDLLLARGHDVVAVDNADRFDYERSFVVDRSGLGSAIAELAAELGFDSVAVDPDPDLHLDATVIVGRDWRGRLSR